MYKKQLYKVALISSPIMAVYAFLPLLILYTLPLSTFVGGVSLLTLNMLVHWWMNIFILSIFENKGGNEKIKKFIVSYTFSTLFATLFMLLVKYGSADIIEKPSLFYPFITAYTANTMILIISNAIILQWEKAQSDKELSMLRIKNVEAEHQQLIQQLQPHFLFNALSTLKSLIKTDAELAEEYLVKLSDFLRFTVSSHNSKLVPLSEELRFTKDYIDLQQIRFGSTFQCRLIIPEEKASEFIIPIYALQTLVENAIKHNAFTEEKPLMLEIKFNNDSIVVSNNKIPRKTTPNPGVGLKNLNERYFLICGERILVEDKPDNFMVTIKLLKKK